jgi:hypothetical protein
MYVSKNSMWLRNLKNFRFLGAKVNKAVHVCLCGDKVVKHGSLCVQLGVFPVHACTGTHPPGRLSFAAVYHVGRSLFAPGRTRWVGTVRTTKGVCSRQDSTTSAVFIGHTGGLDPVHPRTVTVRLCMHACMGQVLYGPHADGFQANVLIDPHKRFS